MLCFEAGAGVSVLALHLRASLFAPPVPVGSAAEHGHPWPPLEMRTEETGTTLPVRFYTKGKQCPTSSLGMKGRLGLKFEMNYSRRSSVNLHHHNNLLTFTIKTEVPTFNNICMFNTCSIGFIITFEDLDFSVLQSLIGRCFTTAQKYTDFLNLLGASSEVPSLQCFRVHLMLLLFFVTEL